MLTLASGCDTRGIMRPPILTEEVIELWGTKLYSLQMVGDKFGVTRQAVKRYLNKHGIKTDKSQGRDVVVCVSCGTESVRTRSRRRNVKKAYCSHPCYRQALYNPDYIQSRTGQRHARATVRRMGFPLNDGHIVHHEDANTTNNDPNNLKVFKNQGDHIRWHRLGRENSGVKPLWP